MIATDTNVLLRYLLDDDPEQSPRAVTLLFRFENARAVWMALHDCRGGDDGSTGGADFADALILNVARLAAREFERPLGGLHTFDVRALRTPGTRTP